MRKLALAALVALAAATVASPTPDTAISNPPDARRAEVKETFHGVEVIDNYRWLEDQKSPETRAWIEAQNVYTRSLLEGRPARKAIEKRFDELMRVDHVWSPTEGGGRYFLWKKKASDDLGILYVRRGLEGKDEILIDPHTLSADHTTNVSLRDISLDGKKIVYGLRKGGEDEVELRVMDVDTRTDLKDVFPRALYDSVSLTPDATGFYYTWRSRATGARVRFHKIGTPPESDKEIFGEGHGPGDWIGATVSENGKHLIVGVQHGWATSEVYAQELPDGKILPIAHDEKALFNAQIAGDTLVVKTDLKAPKGRVLAIDLKDPSREKWREIVPEGPDAIQEISLAGDRLFVHTLHDVTSRVDIYGLDGKKSGELKLPSLGSAEAPSGRWGSRYAFYDFVSFTVPRAIYIYDTATGESRLWSRDSVPIDPDRFEVKQVRATSKDGTKIPIFIVHRKDIPLDGNRPTLLYGYGGFDVSLTPSFSNFAVWIAEQGGVYAVANLRGGSEFGQEWHHAGMLDRKQNVFDDFVASAEWLVANGYTKPSRLAIRGGSNGGLLVGAALTQRPELFRAVLCEYPDLDMLRYPFFENNNPPALLEYGDARDPNQFKFLHAYSPYQKIAKGVAYPAVLLTSGDEDTRVPPLQARKMTAALQWATSSGRPVMLLYDTRSGHSGGKPLAQVVADVSLEAEFLSWQLGIETP